MVYNITWLAHFDQIGGRGMASQAAYQPALPVHALARLLARFLSQREKWRVSKSRGHAHPSPSRALRIQTHFPRVLGDGGQGGGGVAKSMSDHEET